ncbi:hypothetical protein [Streptomyces sp. NPDC056061]|uniref:hypothetical protein n=1 Tax=Streptomyces sp. NPDC056061 TaxID=3345700 RepID=UPI0035DCC3DA
MRTTWAKRLKICRRPGSHRPGTTPRAQLDLGDRDRAFENLSHAFDAAPQMARIHPTGREVLRVLASLHRRANPELTRHSRLSGIRL